MLYQLSLEAAVLEWLEGLSDLAEVVDKACTLSPAVYRASVGRGRSVASRLSEAAVVEVVA